jgi:hypothetical protein
MSRKSQEALKAKSSKHIVAGFYSYDPTIRKFPVETQHEQTTQLKSRVEALLSRTRRELPHLLRRKQG